MAVRHQGDKGWKLAPAPPPPHTHAHAHTRPPLLHRAAAVREADLVPSVSLLFRWTGQSAAEMAQRPALRADLLRAARPAAVAY